MLVLSTTIYFNMDKKSELYKWMLLILLSIPSYILTINLHLEDKVFFYPFVHLIVNNTLNLFLGSDCEICPFHILIYVYGNLLFAFITLIVSIVLVSRSKSKSRYFYLYYSIITVFVVLLPIAIYFLYETR